MQRWGIKLSLTNKEKRAQKETERSYKKKKEKRPAGGREGDERNKTRRRSAKKTETKYNLSVADNGGSSVGCARCGRNASRPPRAKFARGALPQRLELG